MQREPGKQPLDKPSPESESKPKGGRRTRKSAKSGTEEERPPLPDEAKPAPELPTPKPPRAINIEDLIADDSEEDALSEEILAPAKLVTKFPKARYIRVRPGHHLTVHALKLDDEDQRPGEITTFVLKKSLVPYVRDELEHNVFKMTVREIITLQGQLFLYMHSASTDLSNNSFNTSKRQLVVVAEKQWVKVNTDMVAREYRGRKRDANLPLIEPVWPSETIEDLFTRSLGDMYIGDKDHPILKRLRGEDEGENGGGA
jgi:hypothetical protein